MKKQVRKLVAATVALLAIGFLSFVQVHAEETNDIQFEAGANDVQLSDTRSIQVVNEKENSTVIISEAGNTIYEQNLSFVKVTGFHQVDSENGTYGVITYRHDGSANALYFEVIKLDAGNTEVVYTSDVFERATIEMNEDTITIEYPDDAEKDSKAASSGLLTRDFTIKANAVEAGEVSEVNLEDESRASLQEVNYKYTNPPVEEISRLLTDKAIEAGVPPEVVKGIAFQESQWNQYYDENNERFKGYSKRCENWDGTNVTLGSDCIGIGIMQVSDYTEIKDEAEREREIERLKLDIEYNVEEGIRILKEKWDYSSWERIPTVNDNDPMYLDNWYFAILAYNGLSSSNDPLKNPGNTYQDEVYEWMDEYSHAEVTPFPTEILEPIYKNGYLWFDSTNYQTPEPLTYSAQSLKSGAVAYVKGGVTLRSKPDRNSSNEGWLTDGTEVKIIDSYETDKNIQRQYNWLKIETSDELVGWVASGYLDYAGTYSLSGKDRYKTSVATSKSGWNQSNAVVLGQGLDPVDALTGSVLASGLDVPLLLTPKDRLIGSVAEEIERLQASEVYILGGENAIAPKVESDLKKVNKNIKVIRVKGSDRFGTAAQVAERVAEQYDVKEVFLTTGKKESSDALAIAPYAGENNIPILLTVSHKLGKAAKAFIEENDISKVTIIGGTGAVSDVVEKELKAMVGKVERVSGSSRFDTNLAIINKYYDVKELENIFVAQGMDMADSLSAAPLAAKKQSPLILTMSNRLPEAVGNWLDTEVKTRPDVYFLGGNAAISQKVREQIIEKVK